MDDDQIKLVPGWDYDYELKLWVRPERPKTLIEFTESVSQVVAPLLIDQGQFNLGDIHCEIGQAGVAPPVFPGVPEHSYPFCINVDSPGGLIWSALYKPFALTLALGIRTKFLCVYLLTNDQDHLVAQSGTNKELIVNMSYNSWAKGELAEFRTENTVEVRI